MPLPSLEQESDLPLPVSPALALAPSSHKHVAKNALVTADPPIALNDFCEFEVGDDFGNPSELDVSIKSNIEHHDLDESEAISLQEPRRELSPLMWTLMMIFFP